jgi:hypothetical protein
MSLAMMACWLATPKADDIVAIEHPAENPAEARKDPANAAASAVNALPLAYADFRILYYQDTQDTSDWQ